MENRIMTDEELDAQLGTRSRQFEKFRKISVDNGTDTAGTGATGKFVEKQYDSTTKQTTRIEFADAFPGIILAVKTQLKDRGQYPTWMTNEFDASNFDEVIKIYPLKESKLVRDENGKFIFSTVSKKFVENEEGKNVSLSAYRQIQQKQSVRKPDGRTENLYNYLVILYVGVDGEVIKLEFKGTSRGNWFDYSKFISKIGAKIYNVMTIFSTYKDTTTGKYAIKFDVDKDENGVPTSVDPEDVREMRIQVAKSMVPFQGKSIGSGYAQAQIGGQPQSVPDNSPIREDEIIPTNEDEINFAGMDTEEEIPFTGNL